MPLRSRAPTIRLGAAAWIGLAIAALVFVVFIPAYAYDYERHDGFVWDDDDHYLNDHLVRAGDGWWRIWLDPQPGVVGEQRRRRGLELLAAHADDVLDRAAALGPGSARQAAPARIAPRERGAARGQRGARCSPCSAGSSSGAALAALLFAVHPVGARMGRLDHAAQGAAVDASLPVSLVGWLRFTASGAARWYLFTSAAFLLALMAKTTTVMFPVALVLLHGYQQQPWTRRAVLRLAPFFAMALVAGRHQHRLRALHRFDGRGLVREPGGTRRRRGDDHLVLPRQADPAAGPLFQLSALADRRERRLQLSAERRRAWRSPCSSGGFGAAGRARGSLPSAAFWSDLFPVLGFLDVYGMRYAHVADHWQYLAGSRSSCWSRVDRFDTALDRPRVAG